MAVPVTLTDAGGATLGKLNPKRIQVEEGSNSFYLARAFRSYLEAIIPVAGPAVCARFVSPVNFILKTQTLNLTQGALRAEIFVGAVTPSGVWTAVPVFGVNRMTNPLVAPVPLPAGQVTIESGGQFTGGTPTDLLMVRTASTNGTSANVNSVQSQRGLPPGTYYIRFSTLAGGLPVNDAAQMLYTLSWEEIV